MNEKDKTLLLVILIGSAIIGFLYGIAVGLNSLK